jgi:hypothetical protein
MTTESDDTPSPPPLIRGGTDLIVADHLRHTRLDLHPPHHRRLNQNPSICYPTDP